jgi:hypothetical protein
VSRRGHHCERGISQVAALKIALVNAWEGPSMRAVHDFPEFENGYRSLSVEPWIADAGSDQTRAINSARVRCVERQLLPCLAV